MVKEIFLERIYSEICAYTEEVSALMGDLLSISFSRIPMVISSVKKEHITKNIEKANFHKNKNYNFNIFDDLYGSKKFFETDHSKIIKKIFDKENVIGNKEHIHILLNLLNIDDINFNDYIVEIEKGLNDNKQLGRIDIILYENKKNGKCIIIENKITGKADDKDNQLARYYRITEILEKRLIAIIYLPFYYKQPPLRDYSGEFKKYIPDIETKLKILPAIDPLNQKDFIHGFLNKCFDLANEANDQTRAVCIQQYSKFIESKGDEEAMAKNTNNKFLEKLLIDRETREIVEDIVEIWAKKNELLDAILKERLHSCNFKEEEKAFLKKIGPDVFIYFGLVNDNFEIGFGHMKDKFSKELIKSLSDLLQSEEFSNHITFSWGDVSWVCGFYNKDKLLGSYDTMFNELLNIIKKLEDKIKNLI
jgi:hypothetical protein